MSMTRGNQTGVDAAFKEFLFTRGYLVNDAGENRADCVRALFALGRVFGIRVVSNPQLATFEMVDLASRLIGKEVPAPFYRGFPRSVLALSEDQRIADQLIHYAVTYGLGDFSRPGHSVLEQEFERLAFTEASERRPFSIIGPEEALALVRTAVQDLLASTRPLKADQESVVLAYARRFPADITLCRSKDTAICLLCELREPAYARFIRLPDVIRLADEINVRRGLPGPTDRQAYGKKPVKGQDTGAAPQERSVRKLNLANQDRKLIAKVIDSFFETGEAPDVRECYEKRRLWSGLLHHIHYVPRNPHATAFAQAMRRGGANRSAEAAFEAAVRRGEIRKAAALLAREKGSGAVARRLNYLLSRCEKGEDVSAVLSSMGSPNLILLLQMLLQYRNYRPDGRTFRFVQHHRLKTHEETEDERARRRSVLDGDVRAAVEAHLGTLLRRSLAARRIGKVYVEEGMEKIAVPLQEGTGASGFGVLPRGSRLAIGAGNKVRCFTYWEKVDDIDLACFGLEETGNRQIEFSWRTMAESQSEGIVYSGDQTSGYSGGSEYFDLQIDAFRELYPDVRYVVFTDNVFTAGCHFDDVLCTAGFMIRSEEDSGAVFEPKTVKTAFRLNVHSTFACLFALDLQEREIVWLNLGLDSEEHVAGARGIAMVRDYLDVVSFMNLASLFRGMADGVTDTPEEADVIVADHYEGPIREGQVLIRSRDTEKVLPYLTGMNAAPGAGKPAD